MAEGQAAGAICIIIGNKDGVAAEPVAVVVFLSLVLPGLFQIIRHQIVMDGDEQVGVPIVSARHTLNRLGNFAPLVIDRMVLSNTASCSDCAMTSASLRLNSYSGTPRALSAPAEVAVWPNVNQDPKCRTRAAGAVARVLCCNLLGAHRLAGCRKDQGECDDSDRCNLADDHVKERCIDSRPSTRPRSGM